MSGAAPVQAGLVDALAGSAWRRREVSFLLGTDERIERERRVAFAPRHLARLGDDLRRLGLAPTLYAVAGAGERAGDGGGFPDPDYAAAGATVVPLAATPALGPLDVVHALKEPTAWEAELEAPFLRIGAVHLASRPPGVCALVGRRSFAAIFDGGTVGSCSYLSTGGDRTPIVAAMSRFAGAVAGRKLVEGIDRHGLGQGKIVVVGGGVAGLAAARVVAARARPLVVVEPLEPARERLAGVLAGWGVAAFEIVPALLDAVMDDAIGVVFAQRVGALAAPKVCTLAQIHRMRRGAAISDIAIDQGGSILHDGHRDEDDAATARRKYGELLADYAYYAEMNMPREEPREASELHGDASLPYVTLLLALAALLGGPREVSRHLLAVAPRLYQRAEEVADLSLRETLERDLRNGLQLAFQDGELRVADADVERDAALMAWLRGCAAA